MTPNAQHLASLLHDKELEFSGSGVIHPLFAKSDIPSDCRSNQSTPVSVCNDDQDDMAHSKSGNHSKIGSSTHQSNIKSAADLFRSSNNRKDARSNGTHGPTLHSEDSQEYIEEMDVDDLMHSDSEESTSAHGPNSSIGNQGSNGQMPRRKKKTRTVFTRSQVCKIIFISQS